MVVCYFLQALRLKRHDEMKRLSLRSFNIPLPSDWRAIVAKLAAGDGMKLSQWVRENCIRPKLEGMGFKLSDVARMGAPEKGSKDE